MAYGSNICSKSFFTIIVFRNRFSQIDFPTYFRERFFSQHRFSNSCLLLPKSLFKVGFVTKIVFQSRFPKSIFSVIFKIVFQYRFSKPILHKSFFQHLFSPKSFFQRASACRSPLYTNRFVPTSLFTKIVFQNRFSN